jgi:hypothetical protein
VRELSDLVHRYASYVDDHRTDLVATLFTATGVLVLPEPPAVLDPVHEHSVDAAMSQLAAIPRTFHAIVGEVYDVSGAAATGRIACVAHHVIDPKTDLVWHLRYLDTYVLEDRWLISRRELWIDLIETRPLKRART